MYQSLLNNRYLVRALVLRDLRDRYIGSILGAFWSVLNPLLQLALYTMVFSVILKQRLGPEQSTARFAEYLFCALLPWLSIQEVAVRSSRGFFDHGNLIKKLRFPLESIPFSLVCSAAAHQIVGSLVFAVVLTVNGRLSFTHLALTVPVFAVQILLMFGLALSVACLTVFLRDIAQVIGVLFMLLFWTTPIVYSKSMAPPLFQILLNLNPLTHMVEAYRYAFLGDPVPSLGGVLYWTMTSLLALLLGQRILNSSRHELVDLI